MKKTIVPPFGVDPYFFFPGKVEYILFLFRILGILCGEVLLTANNILMPQASPRCPSHVPIENNNK